MLTSSVAFLSDSALLSLADKAPSSFFPRDEVVFGKFMSFGAVGSPERFYMDKTSFAHRYQSMFISVFHVFACSNILKVIHRIMGFYPVFVVTLKSIWSWAKKRFAYNRVNKSLLFLVASIVKNHTKVPFCGLPPSKNLSSERVSARLISPHPATCRHGVNAASHSYFFPAFGLWCYLGRLCDRIVSRHCEPPNRFAVFRPREKRHLFSWPFIFIVQIQ